MADVIAPRMQQEMELAAFEKGRLQGELEANRRMEAENLHREKVLLPVHNAVVLPVQQLPAADVVEINRLTWLQRGAGLIGEACTLAQVVLTIVWVKEYRGNFGWANSNGADVSFWNTHYLTNCLGLLCLANAITNYRMAPLRLSPFINRAWYVFLQMSVIVCFTLSLVSIIRATPERSLWSVYQWVYVMAYGVVVLHSLFSIIVTLLEPLHHRNVNKLHNGNYANWSRTGSHLETPEQRRDHSAYNHAARTVYAPAPAIFHHNNHAANANLGSAANTTHTTGATTLSNTHNNTTHHNNVVPVAPHAPRWAENPKTYAGSYWLLPRAKWAVVGFWAIGAAVLMDIAASQQLIASGDAQWSSEVVAGTNTGIDRTGREMALLGALGMMLIGMLMNMSYVAMPPRTNIVKNGIMTDANANNMAARRTSISHNAETRIGPNIV